MTRFIVKHLKNFTASSACTLAWLLSQKWFKLVVQEWHRLSLHQSECLTFVVPPNEVFEQQIRWAWKPLAEAINNRPRVTDDELTRLLTRFEATVWEQRKLK